MNQSELKETQVKMIGNGVTSDWLKKFHKSIVECSKGKLQQTKMILNTQMKSPLRCEQLF